MTWMDDVLADSFPASDPPSWTSGIARPVPPTTSANNSAAASRLIVQGGDMLRKGELVPHFNVVTVAGEHFDYSDIWQRKNLVLLSLPREESVGGANYLSRLTAQMSAFTGSHACVMTQDNIPGLPSPGVLVADRWGEIHHLAHGDRVEDLSSPDELVEWLRYVQSQCPECEGEAK